jgi:hypothetical protein
MKKLIFLFMLSSCSNNNQEDNLNNQINFNNNYSFIEYKKLLNNYNKNSKYPNLDN